MEQCAITLNTPSPLTLSRRNLGFGISSTPTYIPPSPTLTSGTPSPTFVSPNSENPSDSDGDSPIDSIDALPVILILFLIGFLSMVATYAFRRWHYGRTLGLFNGLEGYAASQGAYSPGTGPDGRAVTTDKDPREKPILHNLSAEGSGTLKGWKDIMPISLSLLRDKDKPPDLTIPSSNSNSPAPRKLLYFRSLWNRRITKKKQQTEEPHVDNDTAAEKIQIAVAIAMPSPHSFDSSLSQSKPSFGVDVRESFMTRDPAITFEVATDDLGRVVYSIGLTEIPWHHDDLS